MANFAPFPCNEIQALTMLYLQNQDLSAKSAEEILDLYDATYKKIEDHRSSQKTTNWFDD